MSNFLEKMADDLDSLDYGGTVKLNEDAFKRLYLPYMIGEKHNENLVAKWIELSGSPLKEVQLVNEQGEVVNTLPPLIQPNIDANENGELDNMANSLTEGKLQEDMYGASPIISSKMTAIANCFDKQSMSDEWVSALKPYISETKDGEEEVGVHSSNLDNEDEIELEF